MTLPDLINGTYECAGGLFVALDVWRLAHDKRVQGVHWLSRLFFWSWGAWNIYFYPQYDLWLSFWGGVVLTIAATVHLSQMIWYGPLADYRGGYRPVPHPRCPHGFFDWDECPDCCH